VGASAWSYRTTYRPDINAVLQDLRWKVFHEGDYLDPDKPRDPTLDLSEEEYRATVNPDADDGGIGTSQFEHWRLAKSRPRGTDPDSLAAERDDGTHSIIDIMEGVSDRPAPMSVSPLTDQESMTIFGTLTPTLSDVLAAEDELLELRPRWQGVYVISYVGSRPSELHFMGYSGD
jgi:hypothetical protein